MLGLSANLIKSAYRRGLAYVRDGLKLYMPYRGADHSEVKFVGAGSTSFDGNDHIDTGTGIDLGSTTDFTITLWAKAADWTNQMMMGKIVDGSNRWYFRCDASDYLNFFSIAGGSNGIIYTGTTALTNGEWTHIAFVADRDANTKGYINGVLDDTDTGTDLDLDIDISSDFNIGKVASDYFTGNIKNVAIWNRALTSTEIQNVMYKTYDELSGRLTTNLVSWWTLESDYTDSKGSNNGTANGDPVQNADVYGGDTPIKPRAIDNAPTVQADGIGIGSASFDGTDDYINCGNDSSLLIVGDMSVAFWMNRTDEGEADGLITKRAGGGGDDRTNFQIDVAATKIRIYGGGDTVASATSIVLGEWTHVAFTVDSGATDGCKIYINGVQDAIGDVTITADSANDPKADLRFGNNVTDSNFYNGNLAQVGIWTKIMTQAQVQSVMEKTYDELNTDDRTSLVSYWGLDVDANDSHGSNDGDLS